MVDRRRLLRGLLLGAAGAAVPAACGVPTSGRPIIDERASAGGSGGSRGLLRPPGPDGITDAVELIRRYLTAVAGDLGDKRKDSARAFLTPSARAAWQPNDQIVVVREIGYLGPSTASGAKGETVTVDVQPIGVLGVSGPGNGSLDTPTSTTLRRLEFTVVVAGDSAPAGVVKLIDSQKLSDLAGSLLLSVEGIKSAYLPQLLYYWDTEGRGLVPDLRYLPQIGLSEDGRPTWIVNTLLAGPVSWLSPAVVGPPGDTQLKLPNVVRKDGTLIVDLNSTASTTDLNKLMAQLRWSLRRISTDPDAPVQLRIASQAQPSVNGEGHGYLQYNLADLQFRDANPTGYCIAGGKVRPLKDPDAPVPPVLRGAHNAEVTSAAMRRGGTMAALVVGPPAHRVLRLVQVANAANPPRVADFALPRGEAGRPAWVPGTTPRVLIAVGGHLYTATPGSGPVLVADGVSAFSVGPDGMRIALVTTDGGLAMAALSSSGDSVSIGKWRPVDTARVTDLRAVAWTRLDRLVIAGRLPEGRYGLYELGIDGAYANQLSSQRVFDDQITQVVAYPPLPSLSSQSGPVMMQTTTSGAYQVPVGQEAEALKFEYSSGVAPSPSAGTQPEVLSAPFYQD